MKTIILHELKQNARVLIIWSAVIAALIVMCMIIFPDMHSQAQGVEEMFASMGGFSSAFGLDQISITDPLGYYGIECGALLGLGGAFFAAMIGARMLSKEEVDQTAEFLLVHPLKRSSFVSGKLAAMVVLILLFDAVCLVFGIASFALISEPIEGNGFWLLHVAQLILHLEIACICFGVSALLKRGSIGFGFGLAALFYFLNIFANLSSDWEFIRYITPFGYADASNVLPDAAISIEPLICGFVYIVLSVLFAYVIYSRKDIAV